MRDYTGVPNFKNHSYKIISPKKLQNTRLGFVSGFISKEKASKVFFFHFWSIFSKIPLHFYRSVYQKKDRNCNLYRLDIFFSFSNRYGGSF